ncbi:hypothetical protein [Parvularcula lutaonensis]|uniref:Uncharacterized protein n=1 Tax=Parvularcula lutaonensis TaxID=491923 RepID=A0ABV7M995_9PROT|nr:hypothetical protein [Parvularcula lutaonensis]GGY46788.1 hypothetical protein GCM10007148_14900 [Parvularcula lutaonensis]
MFFRRKKHEDDSDLREEFQTVKATVEGSQPGAVEESPAGEAVFNAPVSTDAAIRLFPGFEREDFEVGFAPDSAAPSLMMRWKDGGEWFTVPSMFNRAVLSAMDERESANDLNRLLRSYGYDVEVPGE